MFDPAKYLERIGYRGATGASAGTLRALHRAHMLAVPFENLDIHIGREIVPDEDRFFEKVVVERRGGFCYELNGAFARLLRELGFSVDRLSARVARADGTFGYEFDHMLLLIRLEEAWIADVGFGDSFVEPLRLVPRVEQRDPTGVYRLSEDGADWLLERKHDAEWRPEYRFTLRPRLLGDYGEMCAYHQTSPESSFTQKRVCSLATEVGRITLSDLRWIETIDGVKSERELPDDEAWKAALRERFGVVLAKSEG